jgi:hypothetical protein
LRRETYLRNPTAPFGRTASPEAELPFPLSEVLDSAIRALAAQPMGERIKDARAQLTATPPTKEKGRK